MAQEELRKQGQSLIKEHTREPRRHKVIILNDDFTTFEFVIEVVMTVFRKTYDQACEIAETTHVHQKATVGVYSHDIARTKVNKATELARAEGFPLRFEIQPE